MNRIARWTGLAFAAWAVQSCAGSSTTTGSDAATAADAGSGGASDAGSVYDAGPPCSERVEANCDPADDCGCGLGLRCAQVYDSLNPLSAHTACVSVGPTAIGGSCVVDAQTHLDDCTGGAACLSSGCQELCHVALGTECPSDRVCLAVAGYFADRPGIGACHPTCDPLADACPPAQACFFDTRVKQGVCATVEADPYTGTIGSQGDACQAANSCERGTACLLLDDQSPTGNRCATYCDPTARDVCPGLATDGSLVCRSLDTLYPNAAMPTGLGLCVPSAP